jgi:hypothetical protein
MYFIYIAEIVDAVKRTFGVFWGYCMELQKRAGITNKIKIRIVQFPKSCGYQQLQEEVYACSKNVSTVYC